jgi:hypothetical protein
MNPAHMTVKVGLTDSFAANRARDPSGPILCLVPLPVFPELGDRAKYLSTSQAGLQIMCTFLSMSLEVEEGVEFLRTRLALQFTTALALHL